MEFELRRLAERVADLVTTTATPVHRTTGRLSNAPLASSPSPTLPPS
ncbi:hypothetical protein ACQEVF_43250 [Nonomuraea polychroma]